MTSTPYVDVVATYGADPTGATDSTVAIQNAVNFAATIAPAVVYFYQGTYKVSGTIALAANVSFRAEPGAQINLTTSGQFAFTFIKAQTQTPSVGNIEFNDFSFNGLTSNSYCFQFAWCTKISFVNCKWTGVAKIIDANGTQFGRIENCTNSGNLAHPGGTAEFYAYPSPDSGITYYSGSWSLNNYECYNIGNGFVGSPIIIQRGIGFQISDAYCNDAYTGGSVNFIEILGDSQGNVITGGLCGSSNIGILLGPDSRNTSSAARPSFTTVSATQLDQCHLYAIYDLGGSWNNFDSLNLTTSGVPSTYAVFLSPGIHDKVNNCHIDGWSGTSSAGIQMGGGTSASSNISITNNTITNCNEAIGVVDTTAQRMLITNNNLGADGGGIAFNPGGTFPYPINIVRQNVGSPDIV